MQEDCVGWVKDKLNRLAACIQSKEDSIVATNNF